jgi:hypothetical protein
VNGSSIKTSRGLVQQRALEGETLAHPAREPRHVIVGPIGQPRRVQGAIDCVTGFKPVEPRKKREILPGGQFGVKVKFVCEQADGSPQRCAEHSRRRSTVRHAA